MSKIIVVTGASRGIGLAVCREALGRGHKVYGLSRSELSLDGVRWLRCDVRDDQSVREAFSAVYASEGRLDLLVVNAGLGISGAAEFCPEEEVVKQFDVNLNGAVRTARAAVPLMRKSGGGRILFMSSLGGIFPLPFQSCYSASKAAMNVFSDALGLEVRPFGIQTCALMLNDVKTEFTDNRDKVTEGDDIYAGRIAHSVGKMEASERQGMSPGQVARCTMDLLERRRMPARSICGFGNKFLGLLCKLLPLRAQLFLLMKIYG